MGRLTELQRQTWRITDEAMLRDYQLERLNHLLEQLLPHNAFYAARCADVFPLRDLADLEQIPLLTKDELIAPQGDWCVHQTWPLERYQRLHRTSGTRGKPMAILDTAEDWQWWVDTWQYVLDAADVTAMDRVLMAFSFGPFIGFWSGFDAIAARGAMLIPAGGMNTLARLQLARETHATVLCCTPTYAMHLAAVARDERIDLTRLQIRKIIVAGEPGGSLSSVRARMTQTWNAEVFDHAGATEVGPWGFGSADGRGLHVIETEFIAEVLDPTTGAAVEAGDAGELVLTSLGRIGAPVIRYRTGDWVRASRPADQTCRFLWLEGGILGRVDDMVVVRGVNIFPSSIEAIVREFSGIADFRLVLKRHHEMDEVEVHVEATDDTNMIALGNRLQQRLGLRIPVERLSPGTLPISEGKSRRVVDLRK